MESYVQFGQRSDIEFYHRHPEREELPHPLQQQAQLPSFRDVSLGLVSNATNALVTDADTVQIIPPHLQPLSDTQYQPPQVFDAQSDTVTPRSIITSPAQSQGSSMPSLTGEFEDMNVRSEAMFSAPAHNMGGIDRSAAWIPATQYQNMSTTYGQPSQRVSQISPQAVSSRTSPNLPPIRDSITQQRANTYDPTYGTSGGQINHVGQLGSYPQMYATTQPTTADIDATGYARSLSYNDGQYARYAAPYPQTTRSYQAADYRGYSATASYDPYRYNNSTYRTSYGDMNYAPHPMVNSQTASYSSMQGDLSGGHGRRRRGNLPKPVTDILRAWFHDHLDHPYPSEEDKQIFIRKTNLTISQVC